MLRSHDEFLSSFSEIDSLLRQELDFNPKMRVKEWLRDKVLGLSYREYANARDRILLDRTEDPDLESKEHKYTALLHKEKVDYEKSQENIIKTLDMALPNFDPENIGFMRLWVDQKGRMNGKKGRVLMRVGKSIRKMFPSLTDNEISGLVDDFLNAFALENLELKTSYESKDFKLAYAGEQISYQNVETTRQRKSIASSCMRYEFQNLEHHPAEAYASGSFMIIWTQNQKGKIGSRCVVHTNGNKQTAAPIYGASEQSIDMIANYLRENEIDFASHGDWEGGLMKTLPQHDGYILPYLDVDPKTYDLDENDVIRIRQYPKHQEIDGSCYNGLLCPYDGCTCSMCDERLHEDSQYHNPEGDTYCETCYYEEYFNCENCNEDEHRSENHEVFVETRWGINAQCWCENCVSHHAITTEDGELWDTDSTVCTADETVISRPDYEANYFTSDWDCEVYHNDTMIQIYDDSSRNTTSTISFREIDSSLDEYRICNDGIYEKIEVEEEENENVISETVDA